MGGELDERMDVALATWMDVVSVERMDWESEGQLD